jgi:DnaJ-class molecular chaperone
MERLVFGAQHFCTYCKGRGRIPYFNQSRAEWERQTCFHCHGSGFAPMNAREHELARTYGR